MNLRKFFKYSCALAIVIVLSTTEAIAIRGEVIVHDNENGSGVGGSEVAGSIQISCTYRFPNGAGTITGGILELVQLVRCNSGEDVVYRTDCSGGTEFDISDTHGEPLGLFTIYQELKRAQNIPGLISIEQSTLVLEDLRDGKKVNSMISSNDDMYPSGSKMWIENDKSFYQHGKDSVGSLPRFSISCDLLPVIVY